MNREDLISVIVPVYNVEAYLARCVDSILAQTHRSLEVILVDDGARDSSGAICDAYAVKASRVKVIHKENGGLSSARNAGLEIASGEYIAFVDSDDWIETDAYSHLLEVMKKYEVRLVCGGRYDVDGGTGEKTVGLCPSKEEPISGEELAGRIFLWDGCDSSACDKLYHRSVLENFRKARSVRMCRLLIKSFWQQVRQPCLTDPSTTTTTVPAVSPRLLPLRRKPSIFPSIRK